jgi:hypothetical protein
MSGAGLLAELHALTDDLRREIDAGWMPPTFRAEAVRALRWGDEFLVAAEVDDQNRMKELVKSANQFDAWLQDFGVFMTLLRTGAVIPDDAGGTVTLRWDLIAPEHRNAATSLATELVDAYRGRSVGGWPKGKRRH